MDVLTKAPNDSTRYQIAGASERKQVSLMRGRQRLEPSPGIVLAANDEIETGTSTSVLIRYPEGHEVLVMPRSRVRLNGLFLVFGEILVRARGYFRAETAFLTAGVEGTEFLLRAGRVDDDFEVVVGEGVVVCAPTTKLWDPVRVGAGERLSGRSLGDVVTAEPAPGSDPPTRGLHPERQPGQGILYRGSSNSVVEKDSAPQETIAQIRLITRNLDTLARR